MTTDDRSQEPCECGFGDPHPDQARYEPTTPEGWFKCLVRRLAEGSNEDDWTEMYDGTAGT